MHAGTQKGVIGIFSYCVGSTEGRRRWNTATVSGKKMKPTTQILHPTLVAEHCDLRPFMLLLRNSTRWIRLAMYRAIIVEVAYVMSIAVRDVTWVCHVCIIRVVEVYIHRKAHIVRCMCPSFKKNSSWSYLQVDCVSRNPNFDDAIISEGPLTRDYRHGALSPILEIIVYSHIPCYRCIYDGHDASVMYVCGTWGYETETHAGGYSIL